MSNVGSLVIRLLICEFRCLLRTNLTRLGIYTLKKFTRRRHSACGVSTEQSIRKLKPLDTLLSLMTSFIFMFHVIGGIRAVGQVLGYVLPRNMSTKAKINFNTRHLGKGDPLPPYNGKLRLYNMRFCPFAQRAVLVLSAKNLDFEVINIDLVDKPEWLVLKSAFTKVPALEISENVSIYESLVVAEYLDDVYPQRPILPKDPFLKAFDKIITETSSALHSLMFRLIKSPESVSDDVINAYFRALDFIQSQLQERGTKFLGGSVPGYADYMIWPWFERLAAFTEGGIKIDEQKYKLLLVYIKDMWQDPAVKEYGIPKELYQQFHSAYKLGQKPNYDLLVED